jgi:hypothetical protein
MRRLLLVSLVLPVAVLPGCASLPEDALAQATLRYVSYFSGNPARDDLPDGWQPWTLSRFKRPTEYQLVPENGATVVRARA